MVSYRDNDNGRVPEADHQRTVAIGNVEVPLAPGWTLDEQTAPALRAGLMGHCSGRGRQRSCPEWFILVVLGKLEVARNQGDVAVRVATMIPNATGRALARTICTAARYELFRATGADRATIQVYQWDGQTIASSSTNGESCL